MYNHGRPGGQKEILVLAAVGETHWNIAQNSLESSMVRPLNTEEKYFATATRLADFSEKRLRAWLRHIWWLTAAGLLALTIIPGMVMAQSGPAAGATSRLSSETPSGTEILFLGTAGGPPLRQNRSEPSTLLVVDGRRYLVDCGIGTIRQMVRANIPSETIGTIFITHHHPDHDLDLANVMANDFFKLDSEGAAHTINIYGPPQTKAFVKAALNYISIPFGVFAAEQLVDTNLANVFDAHDIDHDGVFYQDDKIRVIAAENSHYALMPSQLRAQMKSYSYRFETPHGVIVFTGDTGPSDAVIRLGKGADVLVSEAGDRNARLEFVHALAEKAHWTQERLDAMMAHMNSEHLDLQELGELASKAQVKSVLLYHINPQDPAAYVSGVKKYFSGPIFAGADLDRYCLSTHPGQGAQSAPTLGVCKEPSAAH